MARLAVLAVAWWLVAASPASAHQQISPDTVPVGKPAFLTLTAANERAVALEQVTLLPPAGVALGTATRQPAPWTARRAGEGIEWSGGAVAPGTFEQWGFELDPPGQPGPLRFRLVLGYADRSTAETDVEIAAAAAVTGAGAGTVTTSAPPRSPTTGVSITNGNLPYRDSRLTPVLVLAVTANAVGLVALGLSLRTRRAGRRPGSAPAATEDW